MAINCYALTHGNRHFFLSDMLASFEQNARKDTQLIVGIQNPASREIDNIIRQPHEQVLFVVFPNNIGLNRYDQLIRQIDLPDILVDCDDDSIFPKGFEDVFETVLTNPQFGWVGIPVYGTTPIRGGQMREWQVGSYNIVEAAVGGGLAATTAEVYKSVGGFGIGQTEFDPEDARYQRKCIAKQYYCGIIDGLFHEHHNTWEWQVKYGTVKEKVDNLHNALAAGFIDAERFRNEMIKMTEAMEN